MVLMLRVIQRNLVFDTQLMSQIDELKLNAHKNKHFNNNSGLLTSVSYVVNRLL